MYASRMETLRLNGTGIPLGQKHPPDKEIPLARHIGYTYVHRAGIKPMQLSFYLPPKSFLKTPSLLGG